MYSLLAYLMRTLCHSIESIRDPGDGVLFSFGFSYFYFSLVALVVFLFCRHLVSHQLFPKSTHFVKPIKRPQNLSF